MTGSPLEATVTAALPGSPEGRAVLTAYFRDLVSRDHKRPPTPDEVDSAMREDPSDDRAWAQRSSAAVACSCCPRASARSGGSSWTRPPVAAAWEPSFWAR